MLLQIVKIANSLKNDPIVWGTVLAIAILVGYLQRGLGPEDDWVETTRQKWWYKIDEVVSDFGGYAIARLPLEQYSFTVEATEEEIEEILYRGGYHRNPIAAKKTRKLPHGGSKPSLNSWVNRESLLAEMQNHATVFPGHSDGTVDVYHHYETSWISHPYKHYLYVEQIDKDPEGVLEKALEQSGVEYYRDEEWLSKY